MKGTEDVYGVVSRRLEPVEPLLLQALETSSPGCVRSRPSDRLSRAHDASHFLFTPQAIVTAASADQIPGILRTCAEMGVGLTFRSGGTSLSGQSSSGGVLVDTRRNFRDIAILDGGHRVRVEPGATLRAVNARLSPYDRVLGPDPASEIACTIGGVVANNSSGMSCGTEFNSYRTLESAVLILPSGTVIDTSENDADTRLRALEPQLHDGLLRLRDRIRSNVTSMGIISKLYAIKNTMGYGLNSFVDYDRAVDILLHLVIGSEGTLAFVASATFRTLPMPSHFATGLLVFNDLESATSALPDIVESGFAIVELLDATSLRVAQRDPQATDFLRTMKFRSHAALLVEHRSFSSEELLNVVGRSQPLLNSLSLASTAELSTDTRTRSALWHLRKGIYSMVAGDRPTGTTALLEDVAVPANALLDTCKGLVELFEKHNYENSVIFGHAKHGNIHFMLNERFGVSSALERYVAFTDEMVNLVLGNGGTLKAEHGTGRMMAPFVRRQYGDELYEVMESIKRLIDPSGLLNPGVLLNEDSTSYISHLKIVPTVEREVDRCVECGYCEPVCPSKDLTLSPRMRIALRREMEDAKAVGDVELHSALEADFEYDGIDTCAVDGMCEVACPILINVGDLVKRLRHEGRNGLEEAAGKFASRHWNVATSIGGVSLTIAKRMPAPMVTGVTKIARSVLGTETFPLWTKDLPRGGAGRVALRDDDPSAVFLPACIGTLFGPEESTLGVDRAFRLICKRADYRLVVPDGIEKMCCGTPWKSKGLTEGYESMRSSVLPSLWEASDHGRIPVVCDSSSCTEGFQGFVESLEMTYQGLQVIDAVEFVDQRIMSRLTIKTVVGSLALHPTCSSSKGGTNDAMIRIASAIAREVVISDDWGCCGFAGDRGMLHPELTASATLREAASITSREFDIYASTNRTCEIGLSRAVGRRFEHLIETVERATR